MTKILCTDNVRNEIMYSIKQKQSCLIIGKMGIGKRTAVKEVMGMFQARIIEIDLLVHTDYKLIVKILGNAHLRSGMKNQNVVVFWNYERAKKIIANLIKSVVQEHKSPVIVVSEEMPAKNIVKMFERVVEFRVNPKKVAIALSKLAIKPSKNQIIEVVRKYKGNYLSCLYDIMGFEQFSKENEDSRTVLHKIFLRAKYGDKAENTTFENIQAVLDNDFLNQHTIIPWLLWNVQRNVRGKEKVDFVETMMECSVYRFKTKAEYTLSAMLNALPSIDRAPQFPDLYFRNPKLKELIAERSNEKAKTKKKPIKITKKKVTELVNKMEEEDAPTRRRGKRLGKRT